MPLRPGFSFRKWIPPPETQLDRSVVQAGLERSTCLIPEVTQPAGHPHHPEALPWAPGGSLSHLYMHPPPL